MIVVFYSIEFIASVFVCMYNVYIYIYVRIYIYIHMHTGTYRIEFPPYLALLYLILYIIVDSLVLHVSIDALTCEDVEPMFSKPLDFSLLHPAIPITGDTTRRAGWPRRAMLEAASCQIVENPTSALMRSVLAHEIRGGFIPKCGRETQQ